MRKEILCDSSSLISLSSSCMLEVLRFFSSRLKINFIVPPSVVYEIVKRPLSIKMKAYQLSAIMLRKYINEKVIMEVNANTREESLNLLRIANNIFYTSKKSIHLIDLGEAEMISLAHRLRINVLLMDERTTRALIESPFSLKEHLEEELNREVKINENNYEAFYDYVKNMKIIRSVELVGVAFQEGFFREKFGENEKEALSATLYKLKYSGCSVSFKEIERFLRELNG